MASPAAEIKPGKPPKAPKQLKPRKPGRRFSYWMLVMATALGVTAGVVYAVPIPGLTKVDAATTTPKTEQPPASKPAIPTTSDKRAQELDAREAQLKEQEAQVAALLKELTQPKDNTSDALRRVATMYESMPPFRAGPIMEALDVAVAASILRLMDDDNAAAIVTYMSKTRGAQVMTELAKAPTN